ncbi:hypothetical protein Y032_0036g3164 [Ancylostoma ceylanicum]|uniref:Uncharacterized protein n=1 Tax=Ancylostoma ceylanicum TaxID=53326 RepID=A0A016ULT9_9BILA|nr:hypothetical protein Y032_0036g3164 [Ancylostoma ceylanicum]
MMYLKYEKKNGQKHLLLRQNVILTWTSFPYRKQGGSGEKLRMFIEMNFLAAAVIDRTNISVLENNAVPSVRFRCEMNPPVQLAEDFEILGQRMRYFSGFSTLFRNLKYIYWLSSPNMFR